MTFSIVGYDPDAREWGIAVASKFLAVGAVVPFARAGAGAVATQSFANTSFGPNGLGLMAQGLSAQDALEQLLTADLGRESRQVGFVDGTGQSASFTGSECYSWAGGRTGRYYAAQGNILAGGAVVHALAETFEATTGDLAHRLITALSAGNDAGGDSRGQQSAALLVVREGGGYAGFNDRAIDLRVDDHTAPIVELQRLLGIHRLYFTDPRPEDVVPIDGVVAAEIQSLLHSASHPIDRTGEYDDATREALRALFGKENLEEQWYEGTEIDGVALAHLRQQYGK